MSHNSPDKEIKSEEANSKGEANVLSEADARQIIHLLGEVAILPDDISEKRRFLMRGLMRMLTVKWWAWGHLSGMQSHGGPIMFSFIAEEFESEEARAAIILASTDAMYPMPEHVAMGKLPSRHQTLTRQDLVSDEEVYASENWKRHRCRAGIDHAMWTIYPLAEPDTWSMMSFSRATGLPPFSEHDRFVLHLVTSEIDWLHREGFDVPARSNVAELTSRQRQILLYLLSGDSPKQIAQHLNLSIHTIRDHIQELYHHFSCSGRGELLSKFVAGGRQR